MGKKRVKIRKIHLEEFIDVLMDVYDKGAEYVDLIGIADSPQDELTILVRYEYIDEANNKFDEINEEPYTRTLLDEDLNQLLN